MTANRTLLQHKFANVIEEYAQLKSISLRQALDVFYNSATYRDMRDGISHMHCRSDGYLAEEIDMEQPGYVRE